MPILLHSRCGFPKCGFPKKPLGLALAHGPRPMGPAHWPKMGAFLLMGLLIGKIPTHGSLLMALLIYLNNSFR